MGRGTILEDTEDSVAINDIGLWKGLVCYVLPSWR